MNKFFLRIFIVIILFSYIKIGIIFSNEELFIGLLSFLIFIRLFNFIKFFLDNIFLYRSYLLKIKFIESFDLILILFIKFYWNLINFLQINNFLNLLILIFYFNFSETTLGIYNKHYFSFYYFIFNLFLKCERLLILNYIEFLNLFSLLGNYIKKYFLIFSTYNNCFTRQRLSLWNWFGFIAIMWYYVIIFKYINSFFIFLKK